MRIEQRERRPEDLRRWLACVGALLLIGAGLAWLHGRGVSLCLFHRLTGLPCLTCGATRAAALALNGKWVSAVTLQPLVTVCGILAGAWLAADSALLIGMRRVVRVRLATGESRFLGAAAMVLAIINWLYLVRCGV